MASPRDHPSTPSRRGHKILGIIACSAVLVMAASACVVGLTRFEIALSVARAGCPRAFCLARPSASRAPTASSRPFSHRPRVCASPPRSGFYGQRASDGRLLVLAMSSPESRSAQRRLRLASESGAVGGIHLVELVSEQKEGQGKRKHKLDLTQLLHAVLPSATAAREFDYVLLSSTDQLYVDGDALLKALDASRVRPAKDVIVWGSSSSGASSADVVVMTRRAVQELAAAPGRIKARSQRSSGQPAHRFVAGVLHDVTYEPVQNIDDVRLVGSASQCGKHVLAMAISVPHGPAASWTWEQLESCAKECQCEALQQRLQPGNNDADVQTIQLKLAAEQEQLRKDWARFASEWEAMDDERQAVAKNARKLSTERTTLDKEWQVVEEELRALERTRTELEERLSLLPPLPEPEAEADAEGTGEGYDADQSGESNDEGAGQGSDDGSGQGSEEGEQQGSGSEDGSGSLLNPALLEGCVSYIRRNMRTEAAKCNPINSLAFSNTHKAGPVETMVERARNSLQDVQRIFGELDIPFVLSRRTLLDYARHCSLGYSPKELDISVMIEDFQATPVTEAFKKSGYSLMRKWGADDTLGVMMQLFKKDKKRVATKWSKYDRGEIKINIYGMMEDGRAVLFPEWKGAQCDKGMCAGVCPFSPSLSAAAASAPDHLHACACALRRRRAVRVLAGQVAHRHGHAGRGPAGARAHSVPALGSQALRPALVQPADEGAHGAVQERGERCCTPPACALCQPGCFACAAPGGALRAGHQDTCVAAKVLPGGQEPEPAIAH